jgi:hypothetical protein
MSIAESREKAKPEAAPARPHALHLAFHFTDRDTRRLVDYSVRLDRAATVEADVATILEKLGPAMRMVLQTAAESADATITIALLRQG